MGKILVIDLGTSYFKTALFDGSGRLCHVCRLATPVRQAPAGCTEVTAEDFENAVAQGIAELRDRAGGLSDVQAVTFATQTNSFLLLDAGGRTLYVGKADSLCVRYDQHVNGTGRDEGNFHGRFNEYSHRIGLGIRVRDLLFVCVRTTPVDARVLRRMKLNKLLEMVVMRLASPPFSVK